MSMWLQGQVMAVEWDPEWKFGLVERWRQAMVAWAGIAMQR